MNLDVVACIVSVDARARDDGLDANGLTGYSAVGVVTVRESWCTTYRSCKGMLSLLSCRERDPLSACSSRGKFGISSEPKWDLLVRATLFDPARIRADERRARFVAAADEGRGGG